MTPKPVLLDRITYITVDLLALAWSHCLRSSWSRNNRYGGHPGTRNRLANVLWLLMQCGVLVS